MISVFFLLLGTLVTSGALKSSTTEYCPLEAFEPSCENDEIIIIQQAMYGRMKVGKCIQSDFFLGCSIDVLDIADKDCSGTKSCNIFIQNAEMATKLLCLPDSSLSAYLEISHTCQTVYSPRSSTCRAPEKVKVSKIPQHIASEISRHTSCGLHGTPWILEAQPGQQITIKLLDFSWTNQSEDSPYNTCPINYGYILDMDSDDVVNICGGGQRDSLVYFSSGHSVQIVLESSAINTNKFLLTFDAHGCPEYKPPTHSWIQKENNSLVIGCVSSEKKWKLKCVDNRWLGIVGNCTPPPEIVTEENLQENDKHEHEIRYNKSGVRVPHISNNHVLVFTMACLTILACCVIIILGVYCIKRYDVKIKKYSKPNYATTATFQSGQMTFSRMPTTYKPITKDQLSTMHPPAYTFPLPKDNNGPEVPPRNSVGKGNQPNGNPFNENNTYENVADDEESVKYYILENPAETGFRS